LIMLGGGCVAERQVLRAGESPAATVKMRSRFCAIHSPVDGEAEMIPCAASPSKAPSIGRGRADYIPDRRVAGISKLVRVEIFSKRLQIQEWLTAQIANAVEDALKPRGVAV
jgi:hypothetical protein